MVSWTGTCVAVSPSGQAGCADGSRAEQDQSRRRHINNARR